MERPSDCIFRHENGNCLMIGGFCTSVNDTVCQAILSAYQRGRADAENDVHAKWIWENGTQVCSNCKEYKYEGLDADIWSDWDLPRCPHCDAKMDMK